MRTPGVTNACNAKNPAEMTNTSETNHSRAWSRALAPLPISAPNTVLTMAAAKTSTKWAMRLSQARSSWGRTNSSHSASTGSAMRNSHVAARAADPLPTQSATRIGSKTMRSARSVRRVAQSG
jgi:hypothetical protein